MTIKLIRNAGFAVLLAAAPAFIGQKAEAAACLNSNVSLTIGGTTYGASSCADNVNNGNPTQETTSISNALGLSGFTYLDKTDDASSAGIGGIVFTVTAPQVNAGNFTLSWVDTNLVQQPNLPIIIDFAIGLFGGNGNNANGAAYLLNDVLLPITPNTGTGSFDINFTNNGGQQPNLSHLTLLGGGVQMPPTPPTTSVPEPASLALFGAGLLGLGLARRRKA